MSESGWKSAYVEANGIRIHYWRTGEGSGKPVMVLSHGITDNGLCWCSLAKGLEADYDLILYDVRGHGLSDKPATGYGMEENVADLTGLIAALGLKKPILVGHSMGGAIVTVLAAQHPEVPGAVVLIDPAYIYRPPDWEKRKQEFRQWVESDRGKSVDQMIRDLKAEQKSHWPECDYKPWAESKLQYSPKIAETYDALPQLVDYFPSITAPTLILKADAEEPERQKNLEAAARLPNGKLVHVDGAGHSVHRDKPKESLRVIREFLAGLPAAQ